MNINQIKYFVSVVELGSFSKAAQSQFITVQGMSKAISDLEREVETPLLVRKARGVAPTAFGLIFFEQARLVLDAFHELEELSANHNQAIASENPLTVIVSSPTFFSAKRATRCLEQYFKKQLGLETFVSFGSSATCYKALADGTVNAMVVFGSTEAEYLSSTFIGRVPVGAMVLKNHPLAKQTETTLSEVMNYPLGLSLAFEGFNTSLEEDFRKRNLPTDFIRMQPRLKDTISFFKNKGVTLVPYIPAIGDLLPKSIVLPFNEPDVPTVPLYLAHSKQHEDENFLKLRNLIAPNLLEQ